MAKQKKRPVESEEILDLLDDLIRRAYRGLKDRIEEDAKIGEFIKMFELRYKLTPGNADQKKFWSMLEKVRREALAPEKKSTRSDKKGK